MSFMHPHLPFQGAPISAHTIVVLSDSGKRAVYSLNGTELKMNFNILQELESKGGSASVLQLAQAVHNPDIDDMKNRLRQLKRAGYVRFGGEGSELQEVNYGSGA